MGKHIAFESQCDMHVYKSLKKKKKKKNDSNTRFYLFLEG